MATVATDTCCQAPLASATVAVSGASCIRLCTALRARFRDKPSISSAMANRKMTMAASGHWPMAMAPKTARLIRKLMFRVNVFRAIQPFFRVGQPPVAIDSRARAMTRGELSSCVVHASASAPAAARPDNTSKPFCRPERLPSSGSRAAAVPVSICTACMPMPCRAASTVASEASVWCTSSTRFIRLKSRPTTPAMLASLLRIKRSSVGQSMLTMRYCTVCAPAMALLGSISAAAAAGVDEHACWLEQQLAALGAGACLWSCSCSWV